MPARQSLQEIVTKNFLKTSDVMDDDNEDLFNDEARDEYDLDEGDNDYDI